MNGEIKIRTSAEYMYMKRDLELAKRPYKLKMVERRYKHLIALWVTKIFTDQ